ncbi:MAG: decaprenyl-phosphate phosphoribosyltransferase [Candidatus Eisenbacteria bacterium]|nr:decaprenyl-phosphate phosphoribosyltransferase [Candidatus Eisenbacteria bacterium]
MFAQVLAQLRPRQWVKNGLLFAGVIFARGASDPLLWGRALMGFAAFSLVSSAVYVVNDWVDRDRDRLHPEKRHRPIASGRIGGVAATIMFVALAGGAAAIASLLGPTFAACAAAYVLLHTAYSFGLKQVLIVDVLCIATGFVLRAVAGVEALRPLVPDIAISPWLAVCTFFGALFLGAIKRRQELALVAEESRREVLRQYSVPLLDDVILISAAGTLFSYALYTIAPATVEKFHSEGLVCTIPFVVYGIFRYLYLSRTREQGENPTEVLLRDRPILINGSLWILVVVAIVYGRWPWQP